MRFTKSNIERLTESLTKMERFYSYKFEVEKSDIAFIIKGCKIYVLINGQLKEALTVKALENNVIDETELVITHGKY